MRSSFSPGGFKLAGTESARPSECDFLLVGLVLIPVFALQATEQVQAELNALVDKNILLNGFNLAGLRICAVALTSFSADSTAPAPGPSSNGTATFATRSGSSESSP